MLVSRLKPMLGIILASFAALAYAQNGADVLSTRILNLSDSGKTILLDVGLKEQVRAGEWVVLLKYDDVSRGPKWIPVTRGRVLRSSPKRSLIMGYQKYAHQAPEKDGRYLLLSEGRMLKSRLSLENERLKLTDRATTMPQTVKDKQAGDKDTLSIRKDQYRVLRKNHELGESYEKDGVLIDGDEWVKGGQFGKERYARTMWRSPLNEEFARGKRLETFDKMVANYLWRVNAPGYSYEQFYAEHQQAMGLSSTTGQTVYQQTMEKQQKSREKEAILHREILAKGQGWSSDYSDEELGRVLESVGNVDEVYRREKAVVVGNTRQFATNLGLNVLDNENRADPDNSRKAKWNVEAMVEWYPSPRHDTLNRLGLWGGARYMEDGVSVGQLNARVEEMSVSLGGTWHFWQLPYAVNENIPFVGAGVRLGTAILSIPSVGEKGNYTVLGVPMVVGGVKYNFSSGWGLRLAASVEKLLMEQTRTNRRGGELPDRTDLMDGRLNVGLTRFF